MHVVHDHHRPVKQRFNSGEGTRDLAQSRAARSAALCQRCASPFERVGDRQIPQLAEPCGDALSLIKPALPSPTVVQRDGDQCGRCGTADVLNHELGQHPC